MVRHRLIRSTPNHPSLVSDLSEFFAFDPDLQSSGRTNRNPVVNQREDFRLKRLELKRKNAERNKVLSREYQMMSSWPKLIVAPNRLKIGAGKESFFFKEEVS